MHARKKEIASPIGEFGLALTRGNGLASHIGDLTMRGVATRIGDLHS